MIRHLFFVHIKVSIVIVICGMIPASIAVVLQSLWASWAIDIGQAAAFRLVLGAMPTSIYLIAPAACVVTICWLFRINSENGNLSSMYSAGMSVVNCAIPAIFLALAFTLASIADAWFVAPRGVTMVENVKYELKRYININGLVEGYFHTFEFEGSKATLYFRRNSDSKVMEHVFLSVKPRKENEYLIIAKRAYVKKDGDEFVISFRTGSRQTIDINDNLFFVAFDSYTLVLPMRKTVRDNKTALEMSLRELLQLSLDNRTPENAARKARSELAKRFLAPVMSISHSLLALGILFSAGPVRTLNRKIHLWVGLGLVVVHIGAVTIIELMARGSFLINWIIVAAILFELLVGMGLLVRSGRTMRFVGR